ncbi:MAG: Histidine kinase [uncultured Sulfurovum sp.]|uniref:histidine kinase n=1 Tax=uncultured Sulfurovum sp. TaxID=269237 RepID=A0A6S6U1D3_9BACT|nr:MAG: Histidine kinase [uncultured Sulfurovum sp.]
MNRHSILFQISLFFVVLLLIINTLFYWQYQLESQQNLEALKQKFHKSLDLLGRGHRDDLPREVVHEEVQSRFDMAVLERHKNYDMSNEKLLSADKHLKIYSKEGFIYFFHEDLHEGGDIGFRTKQLSQIGINLFVFALLINFFTSLFYLYVVNKLRPLQKLKKHIIRFSEGSLVTSEALKTKDEISEVSNEFNHAITKIKSLQESRNLFLRNIMHELKTPISKGKLISDLINDRKNQERLHRIFNRFEYLLGEFTKIEQVTSNSLILNKKKFRAVDALDNAFDILLLENNAVDVEVLANLEVKVDYELFSTALKNLIDNGLKYGTERVNIIIEEKNIVIESKGKPLENHSFERAFNRSFEDSSKGLGLGLYITHHIVKKHGFELVYEHAEGLNRFSIKC